MIVITVVCFSCHDLGRILSEKMISKSGRLLARTVLVKDNNLEQSYNLLNRVLQNENVLREARQLDFFEKPCEKRNRLCFERCKRIYNSEMSRKMKFLMKKNRVDAYPR